MPPNIKTLVPDMHIAARFLSPGAVPLVFTFSHAFIPPKTQLQLHSSKSKSKRGPYPFPRNTFRLRWCRIFLLQINTLWNPNQRCNEIELATVFLLSLSWLRTTTFSFRVIRRIDQLFTTLSTLYNTFNSLPRFPHHLFNSLPRFPYHLFNCFIGHNIFVHAGEYSNFSLLFEINCF